MSIITFGIVEFVYGVEAHADVVYYSAQVKAKFDNVKHMVQSLGGFPSRGDSLASRFSRLDRALDSLSGDSHHRTSQAQHHLGTADDTVGDVQSRPFARVANFADDAAGGTRAGIGEGAGILTVVDDGVIACQAYDAAGIVGGYVYGAKVLRGIYRAPSGLAHQATRRVRVAVDHLATIDSIVNYRDGGVAHDAADVRVTACSGDRAGVVYRAAAELRLAAYATHGGFAGDVGGVERRLHHTIVVHSLLAVETRAAHQAAHTGVSAHRAGVVAGIDGGHTCAACQAACAEAAVLGVAT